MSSVIDYIIRPISEQDTAKKFKTGDSEFQPLKTYIQREAYSSVISMVSQTYVCILRDEHGRDTNQIIGYITLTCSEVDLKGTYMLDDYPGAHRYSFLPAVKIARLAVDSRYRGYGIGPELVELATAISVEEIAPMVGCRFLVTDSKPKAIDFYYRNGFTFLDTEHNNQENSPVMFIDLLAASEVE